jgi:hypothetical protein
MIQLAIPALFFALLWRKRDRLVSHYSLCFHLQPSFTQANP